jgi:ATP-binding cassette, subfamily C, bacterial
MDTSILPNAENAKPSLFSLLRTFVRDTAHYAGRRGWAAAALIASGAVLEGIGLALLVPLLAVLLGQVPVAGTLPLLMASAFATFGNLSLLARLAALMAVFAVVMLLRAFVVAMRDITLARLQIGFVETRRTAIITLLSRAHWAQLATLRHARITHLLGGDIQRISVAMHCLLQCSVALVMLVAQLVLASLLAPRLTVFALLVLGFSASAMWPLLRRARAAGQYVTGANLTLLHMTGQFLGGLKLAVSQNLQAGFVAQFERTLAALSAQQIDHLRQQTRARLALSTVLAFAGGAAVLVGVAVFATPAPVLITFLLVLIRLGGPVALLQSGLQQLAHALPAYAQMLMLADELRHTAAVPPTSSETPVSAPLGGPIVFDDVSFQHRELDAASGIVGVGVHNLHLRIAPGECLGVAGPSGAGKTTFADLLVGLYPPQSGTIYIGTTALDDAQRRRWRAQIAYLPQEPFLFHDSIRRNLLWARPEADEAALWQALAQAGIEARVRQLPQGLDTIVGERGSLLSGGERQRIALARGLLRAPTLLVLDEATGAIDAPGEHALFQTLRALPARPAIVMIAHRAESLALCQRVVRFEAGTILSTGDSA